VQLGDLGRKLPGAADRRDHGFGGLDLGVGVAQPGGHLLELGFEPCHLDAELGGFLTVGAPAVIGARRGPRGTADGLDRIGAGAFDLRLRLSLGSRDLGLGAALGFLGATDGVGGLGLVCLRRRGRLGDADLELVHAPFDLRDLRIGLFCTLCSEALSLLGTS
jgi:hypothetical protein